MPLYFAYGSNMDPDQMMDRCPSAIPIDLGILPGYRVTFRGYSIKWDGAVATIDPKSKSSVFGVIYQISMEDLHKLDGFEGYPVCYRREKRRITGEKGIYFCQVYFKNGGELGRPGNKYFSQMMNAVHLWTGGVKRYEGIPKRRKASKRKRRKVYPGSDGGICVQEV